MSEGIKPKGQDIVDAFHEWNKEELKGSSSRIFELGKFYFSVSIGSLAFLVAIKKLGGIQYIGCWFQISLIVLVFSSLAAILLVFPKRWKISGDTDLVDIYKKKIKTAEILSFVWIILWLTGLLLGIWATIN